MVTVADTSPLNYLVLIEAVDVLHQLYDRISAPEAVIKELISADAPARVQEWAASLPTWVEVHAVADVSSRIRDGKRYLEENEPPWRWLCVSGPT